MKSLHFAPLLAVILLITACSLTPASSSPTPTPLSAQVSIDPTATPPPSPSPTPSQTYEPITPPRGPSDPLAGLVYARAGELWYLDFEAEAEFLLNQPTGVLSPDGTQVVYVAGDVEDLYLADVATGEGRNLSTTPERVEDAPQWWPARPDTLVFLSSSIDEPRFGFGHPTIVNLDGSGYKVLDERLGGPVASSPDGQTLAFGCCDGPGILYDLSSGPTIFDPAAYGISLSKLFIPAWSPNSQQLAWIAGGGGEIGLAIFDLQAMTSQFLHRYSPAGTEAFFNLAWSPDGQWIAFTTQGEIPELGRNPNLWVMRADGSEEFNLGVGFNPVWSPDGAYLAFNQEAATPPEKTIYLVQPSNWDQITQLSISGEIKGWIDIP